jgi:3-isopropylmalate/(R)-2-methylmalate dehydratase small subunit
LERGIVTDLDAGSRFEATKLPQVMIDIVNEGGLVNYLKRYKTYQIKGK